LLSLFQDQRRLKLTPTPTKMSTERELAPGGPAQLHPHTLPLTFPDLQMTSAVGIIGKVYGECDTSTSSLHAPQGKTPPRIGSVVNT